MKLKELTNEDVARLSRQHPTTVSQVLNGHLVTPSRLKAVLDVIARAPMPQEVHS